MKKLQKSFKEGKLEYDEISNPNKQVLTSLIVSNQVDSSFVQTVSNLINDKNKTLLILPQQVHIKSSTNGNFPEW